MVTHRTASRAVLKMLLFAGHDTTIMPILTSLGWNMRDWPPYLSKVKVAELRAGSGLCRQLAR